MDIASRIAQFENMCQADPENDMAHFSLGGAYAQDGRHEDAASSFLRCIELNPAMSKAYQLASEHLVEAGQAERGVEVATRGYQSASQRGDMLPANAMRDLLEAQGAPVPEVEKQQVGATPDGSFICARTGRPGTQLDRAPLRGPAGEWLVANISAETWHEWIKQGTKVINELRLDFSREEDQVAYDRHMAEYLGMDLSLLEPAAG
ncbi:MAG: Fe(2+)-trafficking protein [Planctomycetota bacterium]|jgi:Fe-S cluster biosynthesis and repair protein YggX